MTDPIPDPVIYHNRRQGYIEVVQPDGNGNRVTIIATTQAQPWLARLALRQLLPNLMPDARNVGPDA